MNYFIKGILRGSGEAETINRRETVYSLWRDGPSRRTSEPLSGSSRPQLRGRKEKGAEPESSQQSACAVARSLGTGEQQSSEFWAGDRGLLADKEVLSVTSVIIPAITVEVHAVLISVVVGFSFFPEAATTMGAMSPLLQPEPTLQARP